MDSEDKSAGVERASVSSIKQVVPPLVAAGSGYNLGGGAEMIILSRESGADGLLANKAQVSCAKMLIWSKQRQAKGSLFGLATERT